MRPPHPLLGVLALALMLPLLLTACGSDGPSTDREALVALYNATDGPNWHSRDNWLSDMPIGDWHGVTTDPSGRVTELSLPRNHLIGEIPAGVGQPLEPGDSGSLV